MPICSFRTKSSSELRLSVSLLSLRFAVGYSVMVCRLFRDSFLLARSPLMVLHLLCWKKKTAWFFFFPLKQGRVLIYIRNSCKLIFSFLDGALISWSPVGSGGLLKGQSLHKHTVSAISSRDDDSSLKSSRYMSRVIFPTLRIFCFGLGIEIHVTCDFVVFWNPNCATFHWKLKCRMYGNFLCSLSFVHA